MDAILAALATSLSKVENIALVLAILGNIGLGYLHIIWRREEREDRKASLLSIKEVTDALNNLRNFLSAKTGNPL